MSQDIIGERLGDAAAPGMAHRSAQEAQVPEAEAGNYGDDPSQVCYLLACHFGDRGESARRGPQFVCLFFNCVGS